MTRSQYILAFWYELTKHLPKPVRNRTGTYTTWHKYDQD